ncbi:hypothetical protein, partial [Bradyrhizobium sp.]|uniref:hypothetical protein n=1 Tax=Bradyrhizobium sp. TaxID=376 RepID=UPI0025B9A3E2
WLSLDIDDNRETFFWSYLIAAGQTVAPGVGVAVMCGSPGALGQVVATTISPPVALIFGSVYPEKQRAPPRRRLSGVGMWVSPQGLSKLCASRAPCPRRFARRCG